VAKFKHLTKDGQIFAFTGKLRADYTQEMLKKKYHSFENVYLKVIDKHKK
jgi:hypothetical protein